MKQLASSSSHSQILSDLGVAGLGGDEAKFKSHPLTTRDGVVRTNDMIVHDDVLGTNDLIVTVQ